MRGSGIDNFEFTYGTFTCENDECGFENVDATAYGDDWGYWTVSCEKCEQEYTSGDKGQAKEDYDADYREGK